jgi:hypothetical protein
VKPRGEKPVSPEALRAAKLQSLGATVAEVLARFDVSKAELSRARKLMPAPTLGERACAALTDHGKKRNGVLSGQLAGIASWLDYVEKLGAVSTDEVRRYLDEMVAGGVLMIRGDKWSLPAPWP